MTEQLTVPRDVNIAVIIGLMRPRCTVSDEDAASALGRLSDEMLDAIAGTLLEMDASVNGMAGL